jgi:ABC-type protease/lipase transport system fused ATPase/permease subunit
VVGTHASPGIMVAATVLVARALQPVDQLIAGWRSLIEVRSAWQRLHGVPAPTVEPTPMPLPDVRGALQLEQVQLHSSQGQRPILQPLNLSVGAGECLGLIGPSGSGKTSLVRLMLGLRQPDAGSVRLDGVLLSAWPTAQRTQAVGYLPQDVQLLPGTVAQNIARLGPVDAEQVMAAARLAGVHELISRLPQAYDTDIGEAAAWLSGGQRQRIALARAVYGPPRLVVLDEPNASLDHDGERALGAAVQALKQAGSTVVLVSHRPWLMRQADRLAVLRDGALVAVGPREDVLARLNRPAVSPPRRPVAVEQPVEGARA